MQIFQRLSFSVVCFILALILVQLFAPRELLLYDMHSIGDGEYWRLISSSIIHYNWIHLALNLAALLIISILFSEWFVGIQWLMMFLFIMLITNLIIFGVYKDAVVYSGLSGALHGLAYIVAARHVSTLEGKLLLLALAIKLAYEQLIGDSFVTDNLIGLAVFYDSHLIGVIAAIWVQFLIRLAVRKLPGESSAH